MCNVVALFINNLKFEKMSTSKIGFKRVNNDVNGNPRYVCHYLNFLNRKASLVTPVTGLQILSDYDKAAKIANKIGGKKYRGKDYGGGIVFQSYNIGDTEKAIAELVAKG